jgi:hypothetical protein
VHRFLSSGTSHWQLSALRVLQRFCFSWQQCGAHANVFKNNTKFKFGLCSCFLCSVYYFKYYLNSFISTHDFLQDAGSSSENVVSKHRHVCVYKRVYITRSFRTNRTPREYADNPTHWIPTAPVKAHTQRSYFQQNARFLNMCILPSEREWK